jgi:hypothetical protein
MFVVTVPVALVPRLFVLPHDVKFVPPAIVPQNNHTIVGAPPVDVTLPFIHAVVLVIFVAALFVITGMLVLVVKFVVGTAHNRPAEFVA